MNHYFENNTNLSNEDIPVSFTIQGKEFHLISRPGLFSKDHLDTGSRILLETVLDQQEPASHVLDLGCGIGVLGIVLSSFWGCDFTGIDVNQRAVETARENSQRTHTNGRFLCQDGIDDSVYDCIVFNPPIRAGKQVIYSLFDQALEHCKGTIWIVMRKSHGAQSAMNYLKEKGGLVQRVHREKGFWILKVEKE